MNDQEAMRLALTCARSVEGRTSPRPPVGAVVVHHGDVIGQGATAPPFGPHAEVQALEQARTMAQGSVLYTTLEPCCIHVHTPACTAAIIAAGIRRVVVGITDPNPHVCGQGIAQLQHAGIEVTLLDPQSAERCESAALIRPFACALTHARPYVTAKWAMTLDGKIASYIGDSYWISRPDARSWVHDLRDRVDAILVGAGTARMDNPHLTVRLESGQGRWIRTVRSRPPLRVIMTTSGDLPLNLALFQPDLADNTCVILGETSPQVVRQRLLDSGVQVLTIPVNAQGQLDFPSALHALEQRGIHHVLLEGGAHLLGDAFDQQCLDHVAVFVAPKLLGGTGAPSPLAGQGLAKMAQASQLHHVRTTLFEADILIEGDIQHER